MRPMADEARHHHYVSQAYLHGFANVHKNGKRLWYTFVHDLRERRAYETNCRNVCGERDFMRFEMDGHPPTKLEHELGKFETSACEAIRHIVEIGKFEGDDMVWALNLMALMAVRHPKQRENMRDFMERVSRTALSIALHSKERWNGQMRKLSGKTGKVYEATYEEVKAQHEAKAYRFEVSREYLIGTELRLFDQVLELLAMRKWTLYTTTGEHGHFITTNNPVVLSFINPDQVHPQRRNSPGYKLKDTEVFFPLTRHACVIGRWDRGGHTEVANQGFIAAVNMHMAEHSFGQVFSDRRSVLYFDPLMNLRRDEKLVERFTTEPTAEDIARFRARFATVDDLSSSGE